MKGEFEEQRCVPQGVSSKKRESQARNGIRVERQLNDRNGLKGSLT
jgi:hypothetical protein